MTLTEVARRLSQESDHDDKNVITTERNVAYEGSSVRTAEGEVLVKNDGVKRGLHGHKDCYEGA